MLLFWLLIHVGFLGVVWVLGCAYLFVCLCLYWFCDDCGFCRWLGTLGSLFAVLFVGWTLRVTLILSVCVLLFNGLLLMWLVACAWWFCDLFFVYCRF